MSVDGDLRQWLLALAAGVGVGFLFAKLKLPSPAPPTIAGVLGIVGITIGFLLGKR